MWRLCPPVPFPFPLPPPPVGQERDQDLFLHHLGQMLGVLALITPMEVWFNYLRDRLALLWREWLTEHFVEKVAPHCTLLYPLCDVLPWDSKGG